jgi:RNA recognition motif-containing protein
MRDGETGQSRGFAFVSFDNFESADAAIMSVSQTFSTCHFQKCEKNADKKIAQHRSLNNQYVGNRPITVSYAMKKDGKGERHGSEAERTLAKKSPLLSATTGAGGQSSFMPQQVIYIIILYSLYNYLFCKFEYVCWLIFELLFFL